MKRLSVAIATYNEEKNISSCLESIKDLADEVIIVDGSSKDQTVKVANKFRAKVIVTTNPLIFHINKQKAIDECTKDWILQLDADETLTEGLKREIKEAIEQPERSDGLSICGYFIPRRNYFLGTWLKKGGAYPDYVSRLFKKGRGRLPCKSVHEQIQIKGKTAYLKNDLIHLPYPTFKEYLRKAKVYTGLTAQELENRNKKITFFTSIKYLVSVPVKTFINIYLRHLGFLDGIPGLVWAFFSALHCPIAYIKYCRKKIGNSHG